MTKVFTLLLVLAAPARLAAQDSPVAEGGGLRLGPFRLTPTVSVRDVGVDTNVFNTAGHTEGDFTFTVAPQIEGRTTVRRSQVAFRYEPSFAFFATHPNERSLNHDLAGSGRVTLARLSLFGNGSYVNARGRANDEIDSRAQRMESTAEAGIGVTVFPKLTAQAAVRSSRYRFDEDALYQGTELATTLNRDTRGLSGSVVYALTPLTRIVASLEADEERFILSPIRDARVSGVHGTVQFNPRAVVSGMARVGYLRFRPASIAVPEFSGVVWSLDVGYRIRETTRVGVELDHRPSYSYDPNTPYYVSQVFGASLRQQLASRVDLELRARRGGYRYRRLLTSPPQSDSDPPAFIAHHESIGLNFLVSRSVTTSVAVAYWSRGWSGVSLLASNGLRVGMTTSYRF